MDKINWLGIKKRVSIRDDRKKFPKTFLEDSSNSKNISLLPVLQLKIMWIKKKNNKLFELAANKRLSFKNSTFFHINSLLTL
jgi:hypothetical protein